MDCADLTLPALPGLLRRGSLVVRLRRDGTPGYPYTVTHLSPAGWACTAAETPEFCENERWRPGLSAGTGDIAHAGWRLDLRERSSCTDAAWWAWPLIVERHPLDRAYTLDSWRAYTDALDLLTLILRGPASEPLTEAQRLALRDLCLRLTETDRG